MDATRSTPIVNSVKPGESVFAQTAASDATLPLPEICVRALEGRLELERRFRCQAEARQESDLVITTKLDKPVDRRNFYRTFQSPWRRAGVPTTTVHANRKAGLPRWIKLWCSTA